MLKSLCPCDWFDLLHFCSSCQSLTSGTRALVIRFGVDMSSVKYDLPLLDWETRFSLWQVKMQEVLLQTDLDDALDGFGKKNVKTWTDEERRKDCKALSHIYLHLSNKILQEVLAEKTAATL
jgi:hypothetical protein